MKDLNLASIIILLFFTVLAIVMTIECEDRKQMIAELINQRDFLEYRLEETGQELTGCKRIVGFIDETVE